MSDRKPRSIPISYRTRCGTCRRAVELVETPGHVALLDRDELGRLYPHTCPRQAVTDYHLRETLRRLGDRREALSRCHRPPQDAPSERASGYAESDTNQPLRED